MEPLTSKPITLDVDGETYEREVETRRLLVHFLRDGDAVKSCMLLAVQADGGRVETVEGLARDGELTALQRAFGDRHALQCGYCTPGMLMSATYLLRHNPEPTEGEIRKAIQGNICRCTGYVNIVEAIAAAARGEVSA